MFHPAVRSWALENGALTVADFRDDLPATRALLIRTKEPAPMTRSGFALVSLTVLRPPDAAGRPGRAGLARPHARGSSLDPQEERLAAGYRRLISPDVRLGHPRSSSGRGHERRFRVDLSRPVGGSGMADILAIRAAQDCRSEPRSRVDSGPSPRPAPQTCLRRFRSFVRALVLTANANKNEEPRATRRHITDCQMRFYLR